MSTHPGIPHRPAEQAAALRDLPQDQLRKYGEGLGLHLPREIDHDEMLEKVMQRQNLLAELDREALLDVIIWSRRPVRRSAGKEELAREIARIQKTSYQTLSKRGLVTLARLRGLPALMHDNAEDLIERLQKNEGFWKRLHRARRSLLGNVIANLLESSSDDTDEEYQFLPDEGGEPPRVSLKSRIQEHGVVGGIASSLRGAADDYIAVKLDEIEQRIDYKLEEIDQRLAEWRDREVANRLKILRITLIFTVLVAVLSLAYNIMKSEVAPPQEDPTVSAPRIESPPAASVELPARVD